MPSMFTKRLFAMMNYFTRLVVCDLFSIKVVISIDQALVMNYFFEPARITWNPFIFYKWLLLARPLSFNFKTRSENNLLHY